MSVIVVGLNHTTAPVEMRERVAVPASRMVKAVHDLASRNHLAEVVLLSTCNRTEVYVRCTKFHNAVSDVLDFLAEQASLEPDDFTDVERTISPPIAPAMYVDCPQAGAATSRPSDDHAYGAFWVVGLRIQALREKRQQQPAENQRFDD